MNLKYKLIIVAHSACLVWHPSVNAETAAPMEEVLVTGGRDDIRTLSGSAHLLDEETLEQFDYSDLNQVLGTLPGVYIRLEDGYGLRPNIGLRGVSSERSQKVTLTEDGVLIKPAPYSAPAAYYIPNISRMSTIEVMKGPAAIRQGPNNVGGAINMVTQPIPEQAEGFVDLSAGSDGYNKYQVFYGNTVNEWGYWIDALHYGSDGFKQLDNGADTGFERNDINTKLQWRPDELFGYEQTFTLKLGYADEDADETYLGLTQEDFQQQSDRRYAASQLDHFDSKHYQVHLDHVIELSQDVSLNSKIYWNKFERSWNKLDGFMDFPIDTVLNRPDLFPRQLGIIRGEIDSRLVPEETLDVTNNSREYGSHGLQFKATYLFNHGDFEHELESGLRFHHDFIERDHATQGYYMQSGTMVNDGLDWGNKTLNEAETDAVAFYLNDTMHWYDWTFNAGFRYENIRSEAMDFLTNTANEKSQSIVVPGVGAYWQFSDYLGFLVGINKGFSPAGASAGADADPEEALNYEYGLRYESDRGRAEVIGFFSDYTNLLGRCRASDSSCNVGEEFNGGDVEVAGVEIYGELTVIDQQQWQMPLTISYTYTESAFQSSFLSSFSQWGAVEKGDELPYLPEHVARVQLGLQTWQWDAYIAINHQSEMRNEAGTGHDELAQFTDAYTTVDLSAAWQVRPQWLVQLSIDNLTNEEAIVSWRPFGARPLKPRSVRGRVKYSF